MSNLLNGRSFVHVAPSIIHDVEPKFPYRNVRNSARIEYQAKGLRWPESRRCDVIKISESSAILEFALPVVAPDELVLDIPDARIKKIGCQVVHRAEKALTLRFMGAISEKEINKIIAHSQDTRGRSNDALRLFIGNGR